MKKEHNSGCGQHERERGEGLPQFLFVGSTAIKFDYILYFTL